MVQLNTSNTTIPIQPINLYKNEKQFRIVGDWLDEHDELTPGFKHFYAQVQRIIGDRGHASIYHTTIAKKLNCHTTTIGRYAKLANDLGLMIVFRTGRSNIYMINRHPWMGITDEQAKKMIPNLPHKLLTLIKQISGSDPAKCDIAASQPTENKQDSSPFKTLLENHVEEIRSMHAEEVSQPTINITNRNIAEEKETQVINANTTTSVSKDSEKQPILSQYSLEICKRYTLAYAKGKLMTKDEIRDIRAFALYCLRTGEKDPWIAAFIENNYTLTPINPLKDQQVEQTQEQSQAQPNTTQPAKQPKQKKNKSVETKELKGKYVYQIYLDYVHNEVKQGKAIKSVEKLTNWLHRTGKQDAQVGAFVEQMRTTYAGGKVPQAQNVNSNVNATVDTTSNNTDNDNSNSTSADITGQQPTVLTNSTQSTTSIPTPSIAEDLEVLRRATAIESLATTAWQTLTITQKEQLSKQTESNLLETEPQIYSQMTKQALSNHILGLVKYRVGEMLYKANTNNLTDLLKAIGKENFDSLEDYEQAELQEPKIYGMGYFYSCSVVTQHLLLEEICEDIYLELGIGGLAKRI